MDPAHVTGTCSTGRCTWQPYTTLSFCATTTDATKELVPGNFTSSGSSLPPMIAGPGTVSSINENTTFYTKVVGQRKPGFVEGLWQPPSKGRRGLQRRAAEVTMPSIADLYVLYYDPCKEGIQPKTNGNEPSDTWLFNDTQNIKYWKALKAEFHLCTQTFRTKYEQSWDTTIVDSTHNLKWHDARRDSVSYGNVPCYCTGRTERDELCVSPFTMEDLLLSFHTTFNISAAAVRRAPNENSQSPSLWTTTILRDIRGPQHLASGTRCTFDARAAFVKRMDSIAASLSIAMRNSDDAVRVNGTAWRPGTSPSSLHFFFHLV